MNHKHALLLSLLLLSILTLQGQDAAWALRLGSADYDAAEAVATGLDGSVFHTGYFQGTVDFDPGAGSLPIATAGDEDIYLTKWTMDGTLAWVRTIGSPGMDYGRDVAVDPSGNVLVAGTFAGTADFDPGPGTFLMDCEGASDGFVLKLDPDGNFIWALQIEGPFAQTVWSLDVDDEGNIFVTGDYLGTTDFDPTAGMDTLTPVLYQDAYVAKYGSDGTLDWVSSLGGSGTSEGRALAVSPSGLVWVGGSFSEGMDADPGPGVLTLNANSMDAFLVSLHADGSLAWAGSLGGEDWDMVMDMDVDEDGNGYAVGWVNDTSDFDLGAGAYPLPHTGGRAGFIASYDSTGALRWAHLTGASELNGVCVTAPLGVSYTGIFGDTVDADPGPGQFWLTAAGQSDVVTGQFTLAGDFQWAVGCGGTGVDVGQDIAASPTADLYVAGYFWGEGDFQPGVGEILLTSAGVRDIFVMRLEAPMAVDDPATGVQVTAFPNPAEGMVRVQCQTPVTAITAISSLGVEVAHADADEIHLGGLPAGIYLLRVATPKGAATVRVCVR